MARSLCLLGLAAGEWSQMDTPDTVVQPLIADHGGGYWKNTIVTHGGLTKDTNDADAVKTRVSSVWQMDPASGVVTKMIEAAGVPRAYHASSILGDTLWSYGGKCGGDDPTVNKGYCNDWVKVDLSTWTFSEYSSAGDIPAKSYGHAQADDGDKTIYIFGGSAEDGVIGTTHSLDTSSCATGDCPMTKLATTGSAPPAVGAPRAAVHSGKLYVFGGKDSTADYSDTLFTLDLATNIWTDDSTASYTKPAGRQYHTLMPYQMYIVMMGGGYGDKTSGDTVFMNDLYLFDVNTPQWVELVQAGSSEPTVRWCHTLMASPDVADGKFYIHGKSANDGFDNEYWSFSLQECHNSCPAGQCFLGTCACNEECTPTFTTNLHGCQCPLEGSTSSAAVTAVIAMIAGLGLA